jgi:hypothetical protein
MSKVAKRLYAVWLQAIFQNITEALSLFLRSGHVAVIGLANVVRRPASSTGRSVTS